MSSFTFASIADLFGTSTTVGAYLPSTVPDASSPVLGAAITTAAVQADGSLTFSGLAENTAYVAYDPVGGRSRRFRVSSTPLVGNIGLAGANDLGAAPLKNGLTRAVQLSNFITGAESAATQRAGIQAAIADAVSRKLELQFGAPYSGAAEYLIDSRMYLPIAAAGLRLVGRGATIRQTVWPRGHFEQHELAEGMEFDNFNLTFTGTRVYSGLPGGSWHGSALFLEASGIFVTAPGTKVTRISGKGRSCLVQVANYVNGPANDGVTDTQTLSGYVTDLTMRGIRTTDLSCDFGILASGFDGCDITDVAGGYSPTEAGVSPPPHLIYITNAAANKRLTGGNWRAKGGIAVAGHAYSLKGINGGTIQDAVSDGCAGLMVFSTSQGLTVGGLVARNDVSHDAATLQFNAGSQNFVTVTDAALHSVDDSHIRFVAMADDDSRILSLNIDTARGTFPSTEFEVTTGGSGTGNRNSIDSLRYNNTGSSARRLINIQGVGSRVHIREARGYQELVVFTVGCTGSKLTVEPDSLVLGTGASAQAALVSEATAMLQPATYRQVLPINGAQTLRIDPTRATTHVVQANISGNAYVVGVPYNATTGRELTIEIHNNSAGALTLTWDAVFVFVAATAPANPASGKRIRVTFLNTGTYGAGAVWTEVSRAALP